MIIFHKADVEPKKRITFNCERCGCGFVCSDFEVKTLIDNAIKETFYTRCPCCKTIAFAEHFKKETGQIAKNVV